MTRPGILGRNSGFRDFWTARAISLFGDRIAAVALVLYVYERGGTGVAVGLLLLAEVVPLFLGPFTGALADRTDYRRLMLGCDLARCALFGTIALLLPPFPLLLALVLAAGTLSALFLPAGRGAVPVLVAPSDLPGANALLGTALNVSVALGPGIGGLLVAGVGARGALVANALSFLGSAYFVARLQGRVADGGRARDARGSFLGDTRAGLVYLARHPTARAVALGLFLVVTFAGLTNVALVFLARDVLGATDAGYGLLATAYGVGMVLAPLALLHPRAGAAPAMVVLVGIALTGTGILLTGVAPHLGVAVASQTLGGIGNGLENVADDTLLGRVVPRAMLGRVFGLTYAGIALASSLAYAAGGPLLARTSPRIVFVIASGGVLVALVVTALLLPRSAGAEEPVPDPTGAPGEG